MIAFCADLHLVRFVWKSRRDMEGDSFRALVSMRDALFSAWKESGEELSIIMGGDIFDERKLEGSVLEAFTDFVDYWYELGVTVYFVQGNHDTDQVKAIAAIQGAEHIDHTLIEIDGLKIYGLDWLPREQLHKELAAAPACDYVVLHAMFDHLVDFEAATDISLDDIPPQIRNVLVGDVHIRDTTPFNEGICISPGPLHPCNVEQAGPWGIHTLKQGAQEWAFHPHTTRAIFRFKCLDLEGFENAKQQISCMVTQPEHLETIVEIRYSAEFAEEIQTWPIRMPHLKFFLKASATGKMVTSADLEEAQRTFHTLTLANSLSVVVDKDKEPDLYGLIEELLVSPDAQAVVDKQLEGINVSY